MVQLKTVKLHEKQLKKWLGEIHLFILSIVLQQCTQRTTCTSRENSSYFFFFFPQKQKYFFRKKTQTKQTQNNNKKPNPNTTPTPISPFIYIHYLVTLEQSLEESHICAVHTLRHYLGPWQ